MHHRLLTAMGVLLAASSATAAPTVSGNIISWPDDGWYQVQDSSTNESYCQGGTSCEVPDGTYRVINLSTGERFSNIVVGTDNVGNSTVMVDGNVISWPDNGWYQVQDSSTYESLCQGGTSCEVPDGVYNVINLTTGERFSDIVVAGGGVGPGPDPDTDTVEVNGNVISWPDNGWYQVQSSSTHESFCQGGTSCEVPDGIYNVINLSTGERFEHIVVGDESGSGEIEVSGNVISWPDDGWYQVLDSSTYASLCEGGTSCTVPAGTYIVINLSTGTRTEGVVVSSSPALTDDDIVAALKAYDEAMVDFSRHALLSLNNQYAQGLMTPSETYCFNGSSDEWPNLKIGGDPCSFEIDLGFDVDDVNVYYLSFLQDDSTQCLASLEEGGVDGCIPSYIIARVPPAGGFGNHFYSPGAGVPSQIFITRGLPEFTYPYCHLHVKSLDPLDYSLDYYHVPEDEEEYRFTIEDCVAVIETSTASLKAATK